MVKKESNHWSAEKDKSLEKVKQSMTNSLKDVKFYIAMDKIAVVQDRLYSLLLHLPEWRNLFLKKTGKIQETQETDPRIERLLDDVHDQITWEKVYGKTDARPASSETKEAKSLQQIRQSLWYSLKEMKFDIFRNDVAIVEDSLSSALVCLHEWRKLLPEKARPITTYREWFAKRCEEVELEALRDAVEHSGRVQGLIDSL